MTSLLELRKAFVLPGIGYLHPITVVKGHNEIVEDAEGNTYLDFTSGIGVVNLGHVNRELLATAKEALERMWHISIMVANYAPYVLLAEKLAGRIPVSGGKGKVGFFNSGAEAVENAIKIARYVSRKTHIVSFIGSFHGRTYATLSLTGKYNPYKVGFDPLFPYVVKVPYPYCYRLGIHDEDSCIDFTMKVLKLTVDVDLSPEDVSAIIVEPVLGEGGFVVPPKNFLKELRRFADERGIIFIVDEIQTGYCRTGTFMAFEQFGVVPDMVTIGKAMANGLPISATIVNPEFADKLKAGTVGGTFGGNPVIAEIALKVLEIYERDGICDKAKELGLTMLRRLNEARDKYDIIGDVRGLGAMVGLEVVKDGSGEPDPKRTLKIIEEARRRGLLLLKGGYFDNVIRLHPPLTISKENLEKGLGVLEEAIRATY